MQARGSGPVCLPGSTKWPYPVVFLAVILTALALRAPHLSRRPMHTDEAVHAVKLGRLLEDGVYRYDSTDYHGPTLSYFTLLPAWIESAGLLSETDEVTLRVVPVAFGVGLLLLLPLLTPALSRNVVLAAGLLTAISPAMVFYSRYYIQETLLVFFSFAVIVFGYRYTRRRRLGWALLTGSSLGLMHATKETAVLSCGAMALALGLALATRGRRSTSPRRAPRATGLKHVSIGLVTAASVSALFYSSFFTNPAGIVDSYVTYFSYLGRAADHEWHLHPWYYYLEMLAYFRGPSGRVWSEGLILLLAGFGIVAVAIGKDIPGADRDFLRFASIYAVALLLIYSLVPYKTPWNMLSALHGLILLAGVGTVAVLDVTRRRSSRVALAGVLAFGAAHLGRQSYLGSHQYHSDPSNPYVYAHPTEDVIRIGERVQALADVHPDGNDLYIEVISPGSDYWPLPWYLRAFPNTGWWDQVDMDAPAAPVIIASPSVEPDLLTKLYELPPPGQRHLYVPLFESPTEMRPTVEIRGYVVKELWDTYLQHLESSGPDTTHGQIGEGDSA